jgi:hypothetical protein
LCEIRDVAAAVEEYLKADEEGKLAIEARLGVRNREALQALVRDYEREQLVLNWMKEASSHDHFLADPQNTTACPSCKTFIEKR